MINYHYRVHYDTRIENKASGNIVANCNKITFRNISNVILVVNDRDIPPGESVSYPEGNPHPLEYITTKFSVGLDTAKVVQFEITRKYVIIEYEPLPEYQG